MKCCHQNCDKPATVIDHSHYKQPMPLCSKHYKEYCKIALGSKEERLFMYRCGVISDEAIDATVDAIAKVI